jgi:hypothetical protein
MTVLPCVERLNRYAVAASRPFVVKSLHVSVRGVLCAHPLPHPLNLDASFLSDCATIICLRSPLQHDAITQRSGGVGGGAWTGVCGGGLGGHWRRLRGSAAAVKWHSAVSACLYSCSINFNINGNAAVNAAAPLTLRRCSRTPVALCSLCGHC